MKAKRLSKNYYEFYNIETIQGIELERNIGFDSYTNTLSYKTSLEAKLQDVLDRLQAIEELGLTHEDVDVVEDIEEGI